MAPLLVQVEALLHSPLTVPIDALFLQQASPFSHWPLVAPIEPEHLSQVLLQPARAIAIIAAAPIIAIFRMVNLLCRS
jgi:hypothetical protein